MNIHTAIQQEWDRLISLPTTDSGPRTFDLSEGTWRLTCELTAISSFGCSLTDFTLHSDTLANKSSDELKSKSTQLAEQLTYLLEAVSVIETDPEGCTVQLRSHPPHRYENGCHYYELLVRRGGLISLCRFNKQVGDSREVIPAHVTREVFDRLASDFLAVLD